MGDLSVCKYSPKQHDAAFSRLATLHKMDPVDTLIHLPKLGYIAIQDDAIVAACFIREVEGNIGLLDSCITDPEASSELRSQAISQVFEAIMVESKRLQLRRLFAFSVHASLIHRLVSLYNFVHVPYIPCERGLE